MDEHEKQSNLWSRTGNAVAWVASFICATRPSNCCSSPGHRAPVTAVSFLALAIPAAVMLVLFAAALLSQNSQSPFALFRHRGLRRRRVIALPAKVSPRHALGLCDLVALRPRARPVALKTPGPAPASEDTDSPSWSATFNGRGLTLALLVFVVAFGLHLYWNGSYLYAKARVLFSPTFDHGIFVQAMEGILHTGRPVTTLGGPRALRFAVLLPVLYLMAPFYALFRTPWA